jgi:hypothetical protein
MYAHRHPELSKHSSEGKVLVNFEEVKRGYKPREPRAVDEKRHYVEITSGDEKGFTYVEALEAERKLEAVRKGLGRGLRRQNPSQEIW